MCNPIAAISTILKSGVTASAAAGSAAAAANVAAATATLGQFASLASGAVSTAGAIRGAKLQNEAYERNAQAAIDAKILEDAQMNQQFSQKQTKAAEEQIATDLETRKAASRAKVAEGESGGFLNNNAIVQDIMRQGLEANTMTSRNLANEQAQLRFNQIASTQKASSRINQVAKADATSTGLQIASGLVDAGTSYLKNT